MFHYLYRGCDSRTVGGVTALVLTLFGASPAAAAAFTTLSGTIRNVEGEPLSHVPVYLWSDGERFDDFTVTDDQGHYRLGVVPETPYYLTTGSPGFVDEVWDDLPCHDSGLLSGDRPRLCEPTDGTPLLLAPEEQRDGLDFVLERQGSIQGEVTGPDGEALSFVRLRLFFPGGIQHSNARSDRDGVFEFDQVDPGTYYLMAGDPGFADQIWDGGACHFTLSTARMTCDPAARGTPLIVTADQTVSGIAVRMQPQGTITGRVSNEVTGEAVNETIEVFTDNGRLIRITDSTNGRYEVLGLTTDSYRLLARGEPDTMDWVPEIYDDIPCSLPDCDPTVGAAVAVTRGSPTSQIDFALTPAGSLSGRLVDVSTGEGLVGPVYLRIFDDLGQLVMSASPLSTDNNPRSEYSRLLLPGSYRIVTWGSRYAAEVFGDEHCSDLLDEASCDPTTGTSVVVEPGVDTPDVNLLLDRLPRLTGRIVDRETGDWIRGTVSLWSEDRQRVESADSDDEGWTADLVPGTYFATTVPLFAPFVGQLFANQVCDHNSSLAVCDVAQGTPISVGFGDQPRVDFELDPGGSLHLAWHSPPGFPAFLGRPHITLRSSNGAAIETSFSPMGGQSFEDIGDAPYRLSLFTGLGAYPPQHFEGVLCSDPECSQPEGQTVNGQSGETQTVDWDVIANGMLAGKLFDATSGERLRPGVIGLFDDSGELVRTTFNRPNGYYLWSLRPGRYRVAATVPGYFAHVLGKGDCPGNDLASCDVEGGTAFDLTYDQLVSDVDFDLEPTCPESSLCVTDGRFEVRATWRDFNGASGPATPTPLTDQAGTFWFFSPDNVELVVKVLDACEDPFNRFWVFAAGLTDVEVVLEVIDTETQQVRTYTSALGEAFQPILDTDAFATCSLGNALATSPAEVETTPQEVVPKTPSICGGGNALLCLGDRFRVEVEWDTGEQTGAGFAEPLTVDSGYFYFFSPDNLEVVVKVLNACDDPFNRFWVFAAGLTDVGVTMTVTDTATDQVKTYGNIRGQPFQPILDTDAFATCP